MKTKWPIFLTLVFAAAAGFGVYFLHNSTMSAVKYRPPFQTAKERTPQVPFARFLPWNSAKMVVVAYKPQIKQPSFNPAMNAWDNIQIFINDNLSYRERSSAIKGMPQTLTDNDWQLLKGFLLKPDSIDKEQCGQVLKNQLMDHLCEMLPPPNGLGGVLAQIYQNQEQDNVVRDYALQHLATLDLVLADEGDKSIALEEQTDQKVLWGAINEAGDSIAGTALLGLVRLSQEPNAGVNENKLTTTALQLANDNAAGELTQITAYQVCAQLDIQEALPTIEAAAQKSQTISIQISAIGALGVLGGVQDIPFLQSLARGNNDELKLPALRAIEGIEARTGQQASNISY